MKYIETGRTRSDAKRRWRALVDDEDFSYLNQFNWTVTKYGVVTTRGINGSHIQIHRLIMKAPIHLEVDHIDGNRLNNQKSNLRLCNSSQNKCNRGARKDSKSGYKGVSWHKQRNKWTVRIMNLETKKYESHGLFNDVKEAAKVYNKVARNYHQGFAFINKI